MTNSAAPTPDQPNAEALVQQARELMGQQRYDEALARLESSLAVAETAPAWRNIGNIHFMRGDPVTAASCFHKALAVDEGDHASNAMLAEVCFAQKDARAFGYSALAIAAAPDEIRYKQRFIFMAQEVAFSNHNDVIENTIVECLKTPALDCAPLQQLWYNTLTLNPLYQSIYRIQQHAKPGLFARIGKLGSTPPAMTVESVDTHFDAGHFSGVPDFSPLLRPFFLLALEKIVIYSVPFEEFLTQLRRTLLLQPERMTPDARLSLAAALSHYCFNTEYIFPVTAEELQAVGKLDDSATAIALRACYAPLSSPAYAQKPLAAAAGVPELATVIQLQVTEAQALAAARDTIPALTPIADSVSQEVRRQYEESPYPKWKSIPARLILENVASGLQKPGAQILIAGCGTGHEAAQIASVLPGADILAVDLSLSSLSYAQETTRALGFKNITFSQADILQLAGLGRQFDGIISGGVLHHLEDPLAGWQVLKGLLKDDGVMRIALYSKIARRNLVAAQEAVKAGKYPATSEGMRAFRKDAPGLLDKDIMNNLITISDYYHMSMFRDMIFHVQEHCFDLPRLSDSLNHLQLEFLKFILPQKVLAQYAAAFPTDTAGSSLENWHKFEQAHPDTFIGMYQFWCRKKQG